MTRLCIDKTTIMIKDGTRVGMFVKVLDPFLGTTYYTFPVSLVKEDGRWRQVDDSETIDNNPNWDEWTSGSPGHYAMPSLRRRNKVGVDLDKMNMTFTLDRSFQSKFYVEYGYLNEDVTCKVCGATVNMEDMGSAAVLAQDEEEMALVCPRCLMSDTVDVDYEELSFDAIAQIIETEVKHDETLHLWA